MITITTSEEPRHAPADFRQLPPRVVTKDGEGLFETWHGSGRPCEDACGGCGNTTGNLKIYSNWGHSYPNGNCWDDREVLCGACGLYTVINEFTEG